MRIRRRRGCLQAAVDTYADGNRTITLVGMSHVADAEFFALTTERVVQLERAGAEVHYELIGPPGPHELVTDQQRDWIDRLRAGQNHAVVRALLGLDTQHSMHFPDHWHRTDLSIVEILDGLPDPEAFVARSERFTAAISDMEESKARWALWFVLGLMPYLGPIAALTSRGEDDLVLRRRNQIAVAAALSTDHDVVAIWGAAHLTGIAAGLRAAGFRRVATEWVDAVRLGGRRAQHTNRIRPTTSEIQP